MVCILSLGPQACEDVHEILSHLGTRSRRRWQEAKKEVVKRKGYVVSHPPSGAPSIPSATIFLSISPG